jgi:hypothetical protein
MNGGAGAADYLQSVTDGVTPIAGAGNLLQYTPASCSGAMSGGSSDKHYGGDLLNTVALPATLILANQIVGSRLKKQRGGKTQKNKGGVGLTEMSVPVLLLLANQYGSKRLGVGVDRLTRKIQPGRKGSFIGGEGDGVVPLQNDQNELLQQQEGGLPAAAVPAALLLSDAVFGKKVPSMGNRKSFRRHRGSRHNKKSKYSRK